MVIESSACFITLEGIEGAGKTTHLATIQNFLHERGIDSIVTCEPGATLLGRTIREWLLTPKRAISPRAELGLLFADRADHIDQIILPALQSGKWVISDRFTDASLAYQGGGRGISQMLIRDLIRYVCGDLKPDLTLLLDIDVKKSIQRVAKRNEKDCFESEDSAFFERVQSVYRELARQEPQRWRVINTEPDMAVTQQKIRKILAEFSH